MNLYELALSKALNRNNYEETIRGLIDDSAGSVIIPEGTTKVKKYAFYYSPTLKSIYIPSSVKKIDLNAFRMSTLKSITIEEGLEEIAEGGLQCNMLKEITFPQSLLELGSEVIGSATKRLIFLGYNPPTIKGNTFLYLDEDAVIYVPNAAINIYKSSAFWSNYADRIRAIGE